MQFMFLSLIFHSIFFLFINVNYEKKISRPSSSVKVEYLEIKSNEAKKNKKKILENVVAKNSEKIKKTKKKDNETIKIDDKKRTLRKEEPKNKKKVEKTYDKKKILEKVEKEEKKYFDDLLKDLAKEDLKIDEKEISLNKINKTINNLANSKINQKKPEKAVSGELRIIETILLEQINANWTRPPGIKASDAILIKIIISLDIQGKVINLEVGNNTLKKLKNNKTMRPYLDSAIRAVKKSSPFEGLKKDRYNIWRKVIINFKPRETR